MREGLSVGGVVGKGKELLAGLASWLAASNQKERAVVKRFREPGGGKSSFHRRVLAEKIDGGLPRKPDPDSVRHFIDLERKERRRQDGEKSRERLASDNSQRVSFRRVFALTFWAHAAMANGRKGGGKIVLPRDNSSRKIAKDGEWIGTV